MDKIHKFLLDIGIPANVKGFDYIHDVVEQGLKDKSYVTYATNIYIDMGEKYKVKPGCIERNIRHAIEIAFDEWNTDKIHDTFRNVNPKKNKLTNKDFIARSVLYLSDGE